MFLLEVINLKGFKGFYKSNRVYVILMFVSIVCILSILIGVIVYFARQSSQDIYGTRLDGIKSVEIKEDRLTEIENVVKENELVTKVNTNIQGKIIYLVITLSEGTPTDAENISVKAMEKLSEKEKSFYDIQFIFDSTSESEDNIFPIMGYKKASNIVISWTKYSS